MVALERFVLVPVFQLDVIPASFHAVLPDVGEEGLDVVDHLGVGDLVAEDH
jgi:hypothetical protein